LRARLSGTDCRTWNSPVTRCAPRSRPTGPATCGSSHTQWRPHHLFADGDNFDGEPNGVLTFQQATRRFHMQLLEQTLAETDWNVAEAARRLDVTRSYMYKLIRGVGLERQRG
jgi:transcriptional regulator with GAF, ATPase, and Fis domain